MATPTSYAPQATPEPTPAAEPHSSVIFLCQGEPATVRALATVLDQFSSDECCVTHFDADSVDAEIFMGAWGIKFDDDISPLDRYRSDAYRTARAVIGDAAIVQLHPQDPEAPQGSLTIEGDVYMLLTLKMAAEAKGGRVVDFTRKDR